MRYGQPILRAAVAAVFGLNMQPAAWAQDAVVQAVEPGRCGDFVRWIDLLLSPQPPKVSDRGDFLREKVPTGRCDVDAVRKAARSSKYFRFSIKDKDELSESFRFANETLVGYFSIDLKSMEVPKLSAVIHVKKVEEDYR